MKLTSRNSVIWHLGVVSLVFLVLGMSAAKSFSKNSRSSHESPTNNHPNPNASDHKRGSNQIIVAIGKGDFHGKNNVDPLESKNDDSIDVEELDYPDCHEVGNEFAKMRRKLDSFSGSKLSEFVRTDEGHENIARIVFELSKEDPKSVGEGSRVGDFLVSLNRRIQFANGAAPDPEISFETLFLGPYSGHFSYIRLANYGFRIMVTRLDGISVTIDIASNTSKLGLKTLPRASRRMMGIILSERQVSSDLIFDDLANLGAGMHMVFEKTLLTYRWNRTARGEEDVFFHRVYGRDATGGVTEIRVNEDESKYFSVVLKRWDNSGNPNVKWDDSADLLEFHVLSNRLRIFNGLQNVILFPKTEEEVIQLLEKMMEPGQWIQFDLPQQDQRTGKWYIDEE